MILKSQVEWALHCCAILAGLPEGRYLSTKALAEFHGIPKEYLSKALQAVSQAGLVETTLGPSGGYRLAKPTTDITFLDIDDRPCAIARAMWQADEAWRASLRSVRLSDLMTTLAEDIPPDIFKSSADWVQRRLK